MLTNVMNNLRRLLKCLLLLFLVVLIGCSVKNDITGTNNGIVIRNLEMEGNKYIDVYADLNNQIDESKLVNLKSRDSSIEDCESIVFGRYEIDGNLSNGLENIEWVLVDIYNSNFLKACFSDDEIKNILPFEYREINLQIEPDKNILKDFDIVYDQNYKDKYDNPTILSKVLLHEQYVNRSYNNNYTNDYGYPNEKNIKQITDSISNMWNVKITNKEKGITYSYDYNDFVYQTGIDVYEYNSRVELRLKNIKTDRYMRNANGFKHIATGSDLEKKDYGYYYLRDGNIVKNEIVEKDGTEVLMCDDVIIRDKITNKDDITIGEKENTNTEKYYVDINGIVHNLISDIKDANVSDTVMFGHKNNDQNEPLLWRVVENLGGVYTLILEDKITFDMVEGNPEKREEGSYDGKVSKFDQGKTWDESDRRKYLNEVFYEESFSDSEKDIIVSNPLRAESYIKENNFSGSKGQDTYDKVFVYNVNTKEYMKKYAESFEMLKIKKPSIYNDEDLYFNFSLVDNNLTSVRPWVVVNLTGESVPVENSSTNFIDISKDDKETYEIPRIKTKLINGVKLGKYLQYGDKVTSIYWTLYAIDGDTAYYRASQVLDYEKIVESKDKEVKWSNSELRQWLSETFMYKIFSSDEIAKLEKIKKKYQYIDSSGNIKEEECEDFISLLNYDEVPIYLTTGVHLSNKSFERIDAINRKGAAAVTSLFDNRTHKFYSACYKADDVGNSKDGRIEIKINDVDFVGILPVIAINVDKIVDINTNQKIRKNPDKQEEWMQEEIANSQFLFKEGLYGDVIKMGKYQNKDLEWVVLDRVRDYALVIAKSSLFTDSNLGRYGTSSWETSSVREKLNIEIYDECFSEEEKKRIKPVKLYTEYTESEIRSSQEDPSNIYSLDDETIDYLFLPEEKDINTITRPPLKITFNENEKIWLRNGDMNGFFAGNFKEVVDLNISRKGKKYAVRPLMWIKY